MLPTPFTVQRKPFAVIQDPRGDDVDTWGDPVDMPVHAIAPGAMVEPSQPNRDVSHIAYTLLCPASTVVHERDVIVLDGDDYEVDGRPANWTRGPWPHPTAGVVVELRRVEG